MTKKFNSKQYQGKKRVYVKVPLSPNISRLYVWNNDAQEYLPPIRGKLYCASRRKPGEKRKKEFFRTIEEARAWQKFMEMPVDVLSPKKIVYTTPLFSEVLAMWNTRSLQKKELGTKLQYERLLEKHFPMLLNKHIEEFTSKFIHSWIDELTDPNGWRMQDPNRKGFEHELTLLKTLLNFYKRYQFEFETETAPRYVVPIDKGHHERVIDVKPMDEDQDVDNKKDIPLKEFLVWLVELAKGKFAALAPALATVQYFEALRISEAAAIFWEDVFFDWVNPEESYIVIRRHVYWPRKKGHKSKVLRLYHKTGGIKVLR